MTTTNAADVGWHAWGSRGLLGATDYQLSMTIMMMTTAATTAMGRCRRPIGPLESVFHVRAIELRGEGIVQRR